LHIRQMLRRGRTNALLSGFFGGIAPIDLATGSLIQARTSVSAGLQERVTATINLVIEKKTWSDESTDCGLWNDPRRKLALQ